MGFFIRVLLTCAFVLSRVSVTAWPVAHQALLSRGFSRQEYWSGLPFPTPGDLLDPGIERTSLMSPALASRFFITSTTWEAQIHYTSFKKKKKKGPQ